MNNPKHSCLFLRRLIPMIMLVLLISLFVLPPVSAASVNGSVNVNTTYQTLEGFGAAVAWMQEWLTEHPNKIEIYDLLFNGLGLDIYRFRNQYRNSPNFDQGTTEILKMAEASLGHPIKTLLCSWSPPADLKLNGVLNGGTLTKENGVFVYNKFADYWYNSLNAYAAKGIIPDYISIQNEPDYEDTGWETCILRPVEDSNYPAYGKALDAVYNKLLTMGTFPKIIAPESAGIGNNLVQNYVNNLNLNQVYGINFHLYNGGDPNDPDTFIPAMEGIANAITTKPLFQTEYDYGTPFTTALLIHNSLVHQGVSAYFYWDLIWDTTQRPLIALERPWTPGSWTTSKGYIISDYYYVFKQFTKYTDPGFKRVFAATDFSDLKITGFLSPDQNQLTVILINKGSEESTVALNLNGYPVGSSAIYRTIPGGSEKFAAIGSLGSGNTVTLPAKSIATAVIYAPSYQPAPTPAPLPTVAPPPASRGAFARIEAESYNTFSGTQTALIDDAGGRCVGYIENGDYLGFNNVDFGGGALSFQAVTASSTNGGNIEIRLDSPNGATVATCPVYGSGGWETWTTSACNFTGITGIHNLYLVFTGADGYLFNIDSFIFNEHSVAVPTPPVGPSPTPTVAPTPTPTPIAGRNLLDNPGFEAGSSQYWYSFGAGAVAAVSDQVQDGAFSALVSGRTDTWQGIAQDVTSKVVVGKTYQVSAWVRLQNQASDNVSLTFKRTDSSGDHYENVASGTATDTGWIKLSGSYTVTANTGLVLYAQGPAPGVSFYLDNASMIGETQPGDAFKLQIQMMNNNTAAVANAIEPWFKVKNTGEEAVNLADVKIRYFYTIDGEKPQTFWCDWASINAAGIGASNVTGNFVKMQAVTPNADHYLEVGFESGAGMLEPGQEIEIHTRFAKNNGAGYVQTNDYSFNPASTMSDWNQTPGYISGGMRWGMEPSLLSNPGFETGTTAGWYSFGSSTIAATSTQAQTGNYSVMVSNRTDSWQGIAQDLRNIMQNGRRYEISGWFKLKNIASDTCRINVKKSDESGDSYTWVVSKSCTDKDWTQLSGTFELNVTGALTSLELYTEGQATGTEFYFDNVTVRELAVPVTGITLNQTGALIYRGGAIQLFPSIAPENATNQTVIWTSSNPAVATVDTSGNVTGLALGTASVTATTADGDFSAVCLVQVLNRAPELSPIGDQTVAEGAAMTFTVSASDPDGDNLTYRVSGLPEGAGFDSLTGSFAWTPDYTQSGVYPLTVTVSDGVDSASHDLTITVENVNRAPELAPMENQTVKEGQTVTFSLTATDPDGDALTYTGANLPTGASFDPATRVFSWTPGYFQAGGYLVHFEASDGALTDSCDLVITVTNITPEELTVLLRGQVESMNLDKGIKNSLLVKLSTALKLMQKDAEYLAMGVMKAFVHEVNAQSGKKLTAAQAEELKKSAETIIAHLKEAAATEAPGKPFLAHTNNLDKNRHDGNYKIIMAMPLGNNGTAFKLFENRVLIETRTLADHSPNPQAVSVTIQDRPVGTYEYYCELSNSHGTSTSNTITVTVLK